MKLAIISPVSLLESCSMDYHLVLTQYWHIPAYHDYYMKARLRGDWLTVDNGAAEKKEAVGDSLLLQVVKELSPNLVVAPDVIYDAEATKKRTVEFIEKNWVDLYKSGVGIMVVPQGKTRKEWLECYEVFNRLTGVQWLGISKFYTPVFGSRTAALAAIAPTVTKPCHLLGVWDDPFSLREEKKFVFVKGVDTAKPVEYAWEGLELERWNEHKHVDDDEYMKWDGRGRAGLIERNVGAMKELVGIDG